MNTKIKYSASAKNTLTAKRKYILIVLIHPKLFNPQDEKVFQGNSVDDEIYKALLSIIQGNDAPFENSASLIHGLADRVEEKLINELQNQIMNYAENIDLEAEFTLVQSVLNNISTKQIQSQKLAALKNKKLSELTTEEKRFLKKFQKIIKCYREHNCAKLLMKNTEFGIMSVALQLNFKALTHGKTKKKILKKKYRKKNT